MSADETHREAVTAVIFAAAWADGNVGEQEKVALSKILSRLGYRQPELGQRVARAMAGPCPDPIDVPDDEPTAVEIMRYALAVMLADGLLSQDEVNFVVKLAHHLKISSAVLSALGREAEKFVAQLGQDKASAVNRIETLLPESRLKLPELDIAHNPAPREGVSEDTASRTALSRLVYQGDDFGGELEL